MLLTQTIIIFLITCLCKIVDTHGYTTARVRVWSKITVNNITQAWQCGIHGKYDLQNTSLRGFKLYKKISYKEIQNIFVFLYNLQTNSKYGHLAWHNKHHSVILESYVCLVTSCIRILRAPYDSLGVDICLDICHPNGPMMVVWI